MDSYKSYSKETTIKIDWEMTYITISFSDYIIDREMMYNDVLEFKTGMIHNQNPRRNEASVDRKWFQEGYSFITSLH